MPKEIKALWEMALANNCDDITKITDEFLQKEFIAVVIKHNLKDIFEALMAISEQEKIKELHSKCCNEAQYRHVNMLLKNIWS